MARCANAVDMVDGLNNILLNYYIIIMVITGSDSKLYAYIIGKTFPVAVGSYVKLNLPDPQNIYIRGTCRMSFYIT